MHDRCEAFAVVKKLGQLGNLFEWLIAGREERERTLLLHHLGPLRLVQRHEEDFEMPVSFERGNDVRRRLLRGRQRRGQEDRDKNRGAGIDLSAHLLLLSFHRSLRWVNIATMTLSGTLSFVREMTSSAERSIW